MNEDFSERWIHRVGKRALQQSMYRICIVLAVLQLGMGLLFLWLSIKHGQWLTVMPTGRLPLFGVAGMLLVFLSFSQLLVALLQFERKQFYTIIQTQQNRISELEVQSEQKDQKPMD